MLIVENHFKNSRIFLDIPNKLIRESSSGCEMDSFRTLCSEREDYGTNRLDRQIEPLTFKLARERALAQPREDQIVLVLNSLAIDVAPHLHRRVSRVRIAGITDKESDSTIHSSNFGKRDGNPTARQVTEILTPPWVQTRDGCLSNRQVHLLHDIQLSIEIPELIAGPFTSITPVELIACHPDRLRMEWLVRGHPHGPDCPLPPE